MAARLRAGSAGDAPDLTRLFLAARREAMPYLPELHTDEETAEWLERVVLPTHDIAVAEMDGRVAGFAALDGDLLGHLYVDPPRQGRGVGSALFDWVKRSRPNGFRFWVFQRNEAARRFYEGRGCRVVELTDGAGNEEREPDALYEWRPPLGGLDEYQLCRRRRADSPRRSSRRSPPYLPSIRGRPASAPSERPARPGDE